ncbi:MAG: hypothetical protein ACE5GH_04320, partial [Fidelibacterota bacterium]
MIFMGAALAGDTVTYAASPVNYAYDETAGSLAIPESVLYSVDGLDSVVISGTLAYARIQIPANTPTDFDFPILNLEGEAMSVSFGEEGAFTRTSIVIAEGGIETESAEGTWEIQTDSTLTVIETSLDGEPLERPDTLLITFYAISPDTASVSFIEDLCREPDLYGTDEECIAEMERLFGLGSGSLVSVQLSKTILMARGRGRVAARSPGLHWGGTPPGERHLLKMVRNRLSVLFR